MNMPLDDSGKPVEGLYYPTPVTPEEAFQAIGRLRKAARDEIDRLLTFLDETDNHMEREPDGDELDASYPESGVKAVHPIEDDEPSLGSFDRMTDQSKAWRQGNLWEPPEVDAEQDDADAEPSLGSIEDHPNGYYDGSDASGHHRSQERWAAGNRDDCEGDEHDGAEPENEGGEAVKEDDEPSLGWTVDGCMTAASEAQDECELEAAL